MELPSLCERVTSAQGIFLTKVAAALGQEGGARGAALQLAAEGVREGAIRPLAKAATARGGEPLPVHPLDVSVVGLIEAKIWQVSMIEKSYMDQIKQEDEAKRTCPSGATLILGPLRRRTRSEARNCARAKKFSVLWTAREQEILSQCRGK